MFTVGDRVAVTSEALYVKGLTDEDMLRDDIIIIGSTGTIMEINDDPEENWPYDVEMDFNNELYLFAGNEIELVKE